MALYNHEKYLAQAIDSVLAQSFKDWELIIWDDGSTDASLGIAREYAAKNGDRISVYAHDAAQGANELGSKNRGQEFTRNEAFKKAKGEYLALLDSDDSYYPGKLEVLVRALDANPDAGLAYGSADELNDKTGHKAPMPMWTKASGDVFDSLIEENFISAMATLWRKSATSVTPFKSSYKTCGEYPVWLEIARNYKVLFVDQSVGFWRHHGANTGTVQASRAKAELVDVARKFLEQEISARASQKAPAIRRGLARKLYDLAAERYALGDFQAARQALAEVVNIDAAPTDIHKKAVLLNSLLKLGDTPNRFFAKVKKKLWELKKGSPALRTL